MCEHCMRRGRQDAEVSERRIKNVINKFYFCEWFKDSVTIVQKSFDLPMFKIHGVYIRNGKKINVTFQSKHPGGNPPKFYFTHKVVSRISQGITGISPAFFKDAEMIRGHLIDMTD